MIQASPARATLSTLFLPVSVCRYLTDYDINDPRRRSIYGTVLMQAGRMHMGMAPHYYLPGTCPAQLNVDAVAREFAAFYTIAAPPMLQFSSEELELHVLPEVRAIVDAFWTHIRMTQPPQYRQQSVSIGGRSSQVIEEVVALFEHGTAGTYITWH